MNWKQKIIRNSFAVAVIAVMIGSFLLYPKNKFRDVQEPPKTSSPQHIKDAINAVLYEGKEDLNLSHQNLTEIPQELRQISDIQSCTLKKLNLSHNNLVDISNALPHNEELSDLDLSHNSLQTISTKFFPLNLKKLNLSHNKLNALLPEEEDEPVGLIVLSNSLRHFDISHNNIRTISNRAASIIRKCNEINLSYNQLETLSPLFCGMLELEKLNLSHNKFTTLNFEALFEELEGLESIHGQNSRLLISLSGEILGKLRELNLSYNQLTEPPKGISVIGTERLSTIEKLNLAGNKLQTLSREIPLLTKLEKLNISYNNIGDLGPDVFKNKFVAFFPKGCTIDLSNNDLYKLLKHHHKLLKDHPATSEEELREYFTNLLKEFPENCTIDFSNNKFSQAEKEFIKDALNKYNPSSSVVFEDDKALFF